MIDENIPEFVSFGFNEFSNRFKVLKIKWEFDEFKNLVMCYIV
jgi:hypothetical protein